MTLSRKYIIVIVSTCLLIVVNQLIIQYALYNKSDDSRIINVSGKQRMLSQKLISLVAVYNDSRSEDNYITLLNTFKQWENIHHAFQSGNQSLNIKPLRKDNKKMLVELNPMVAYAKKEINELHLSKSQIDIKLFAKNQNNFLTKMDTIVKKLEIDSDKRLQNIRWIEIILAIITLIILIAEVYYIFMPINTQLEQRNKELQKTNATLKEYAFIAANELRTPIINIEKNTNKLFEKIEINEQNKNYINNIKNYVNDIDKTTEDLMFYSSINSVNITTINTREALKCVVKKMKQKGKCFNIVIEETPNEINVDETKFSLLITHLLDNASKFIEPNTQADIQVRAIEKRDKVEFIISDNGIGIPTEAYQIVFGIYKKLHYQNQYKGNGIGLAIAKRIVELHNGEIWIESETGLGTDIHFTVEKTV